MADRREIRGTAGPSPSATLSWLDFLWIPVLLVPALLTIPLNQTLFLDPDEGYNLMRASLHLSGHALYTEIWYDQPPLLTLILSGIIHLLGPALTPIRIFFLLSGVLFCGSYYALIRKWSGRSTAILAATLLPSSAYFLRISVSVMESMPSLALAMTALAVAAHARRLSGTALAGLLLGAAMQVKLNAVIFAVPCCFIIWNSLRSKGLSAFLSGAIGSFFAVAVGVWEPGWQAMFTAHTRAAALPELSYFAGFKVVPRLFQFDVIITLLALSGLFFRHPGPDPRRLPAYWLLGVAGLLLFHRPVWYHYYLLLAPQLCWLAADTCSRLLTPITRTGNARLERAGRWTTGVLLVTILLSNYFRNAQHLRETTFLAEPEVMAAVEREAPLTQWVVAFDRQIYPFMAGLQCPPELAVTSFKRNFGGELSPSYVGEIMAEYRPQLVVLDRTIHYHPALKELLVKDFDVSVETQSTTVFRRRTP